MENKEEYCGGCGNHCPKDNLQCGRGRAYFNMQGQPEEGRQSRSGHAGTRPFADEEEAVTYLRKAGHQLHHGGAGDILGPLTREERDTLLSLLKKCLDK